MNYVFWNDNAGFFKIVRGIQRCFNGTTGFVKWWTDTRKEFRARVTYITAQQIQQIFERGSEREIG